jgi:hypothetical protein
MFLRTGQIVLCIVLIMCYERYRPARFDLHESGTIEKDINRYRVLIF